MTDTSHSFGRTLSLIQDGIAASLHTGAQVYISVGRRAVLEMAIGRSGHEGDGEMTPDTLLPWYSAGKPLTAVAIAQLWEKDRLELDDPVGRHIPPFDQHDKGTITIRHLLTHTAPLRLAPISPAMGWEKIIATLCAMRPEPRWVPGQKAGYAAFTNWFLLGEIVRRIDGRPVDQYVREAICEPLEMEDSWLAMPPAQYQSYGQRIGQIRRTDGGTPATSPWDDPQFIDLPNPGATARGPARQLGQFYEALLHHRRLNPSSAGLLRPQTLEAMTARHRTGLYDHSFKHTVDWGLGFIPNNALYGLDTPYIYGPHASSRAFGHGGKQSSTAFADPEHDLVVVLLFNGQPGEALHQARMNAATAAIYEDLGLA